MGLGEAQPTPSPPFAHTTSLSWVLKGAIWVLFLLAMILDVALHSLKSARGLGGDVAPPFANRLPARWYLNRSITIMRAKQAC